MGSFLAMDFETANNQRSSACAVGLVLVTDGQIEAEQVFLIRPPQRQFLHTRIHGISWEDVQAQPTFAERWADIKAFTDRADFITAHNASFDRGVLYGCCANYGIPVPEHRFVCSVLVARRQWNIHPTKLPDVCRRLGIPLQHHEALSDARACAEIIRRAQAEGWQPPV